MSENHRKISLLGDSISTFEGYSPAFDAFYTPDYAAISGVHSVEDTWWMQVIRALDGELLVNSSHMGSSVSLFGYQPANAPWRIEKLKKGDLLPDLILIYSGLNDVASYITPKEFGEQYTAMLGHAKAIFPESLICCGTLCHGFPRNPNLPLFVNLDACTPVSEYNAQIRQAVIAQGCTLVDLADDGMKYCSIDGVHPDAAGMKTLAELWMRRLDL